MPEDRGINKLFEGIKKFKLVQDSSRDVKYSIKNIVNNTAITMYDARWVPEISGEYFVKYIIV